MILYIQTNPDSFQLSLLTLLQVELQARYETHRSTRNAIQKAKLLDPNFASFNCDEILAKLEGPKRDPGFVDPRYCLVFWARPPQHIKEMVDMIQREIREVAPS